MSVISLITDFGQKDNFVGAMKAVILKINPSAAIVDVCNEVSPQDIQEAAFLLEGAFMFFPRQTVHLAVVDPGVGSKRRKLLVKTRDYFFVGPDNGVLSLALKRQKPLKIFEINNEGYFLKPVCATFHGRDIFAPIAAYLSKGERIEKFGKPIKSFESLGFPNAKKTDESLCGEIIHIDRFGNLISNISKNAFERFVKKGRFKIYIKNKIIDSLCCNYSEAPSSKPLALIDSFNYLEIAVKGRSARDVLKAGKAERITVRRA